MPWAAFGAPNVSSENFSESISFTASRVTSLSSAASIASYEWNSIENGFLFLNLLCQFVRVSVVCWFEYKPGDQIRSCTANSFRDEWWTDVAWASIYESLDWIWLPVSPRLKFYEDRKIEVQSRRCGLSDSPESVTSDGNNTFRTLLWCKAWGMLERFVGKRSQMETTLICITQPGTTGHGQDLEDNKDCHAMLSLSNSRLTASLPCIIIRNSFTGFEPMYRVRVSDMSPVMESRTLRKRTPFWQKRIDLRRATRFSVMILPGDQCLRTKCPLAPLVVRGHRSCRRSHHLRLFSFPQCTRILPEQEVLAYSNVSDNPRNNRMMKLSRSLSRLTYLRIERDDSHGAIW